MNSNTSDITGNDRRHAVPRVTKYISPTFRVGKNGLSRRFKDTAGKPRVRAL